MDIQTAPPADTAPAFDTAPDTAPDRLGAEVRESLLLLALCVGVTAGLSAGAQALLALAG
jgi:hypothetical protein